ncbi:MAG: hypothetical protein A2563_04765 [Candidatus Magasanikbacteria bacterium RIFOXYD1_FULL_40_23]|uniref:DUF4134 domain-containing protein n=1 Tax=Candidatus Magasanikbacteria bacterium RIFOXYD1_FULL_40_23 TaxID=1798705 RepID=A0A1F6PA66_9BACT|nr:MAG: hypothetical protein A2563_04765 [Candidatus Magasanikbacteria bacterium RIFOXYD1_FULL_40_23]
MFKKLLFVFLFSLMLLGSVLPAAAQFGLKETASKAQYGESTDIYTTIGDIVNVVLSFTGIIFLAIIFYGGLRWMTARGDEAKITKAKEAMYAAIIGFILVTAAYALSSFVIGRLTS